jgi:hypothetical protein
VAPGERLGHRVAARGSPWAAAQQPARGKVRASRRAEPIQRLNRVCAAARIEAATGREEGGDKPAIELQGLQQEPGDRPGPGDIIGHSCGVVHTAGPSSGVESRLNRFNAPSRSAPSSALDAVAAGGRALTTKVAPAGTEPSRLATRCRSRRLTRCRTTELPTALLTTKPALVSGARAGAGRPAGSAGFTACTTRHRRPARAPLRITSRKSSLRRNRAAGGSTVRLPERRDQADSFSRPLRRRAARIARPARVRIRSRNPCVRARRRLFGWKVRLPLLTTASPGLDVPGGTGPPSGLGVYRGPCGVWTYKGAHC